MRAYGYVGCGITRSLYDPQQYNCFTFIKRISHRSYVNPVFTSLQVNLVQKYA